MAAAGKPKRNREQIERDRAEIARLVCRGWTRREVGRKLRLSQKMISKELAVIRRRWLEAQAESYDQKVAQDIAKLDHAERAAWEGWERSVGEATETVSRRRVKGRDADGQEIAETEASVTRRLRAGDPRFLQAIIQCIARRAEIRGAAGGAGLPAAEGPVTVVPVVAG
jgi:hypothetical protein